MLIFGADFKYPFGAFISMSFAMFRNKVKSEYLPRKSFFKILFCDFANIGKKVKSYYREYDSKFYRCMTV